MTNETATFTPALHLEVERDNAKAQIFYAKSDFASRAHYFLMSKRLVTSNSLHL